MQEITTDLVKKFKSFAKISHDSEDDYLKDLLTKSYSNLVSRFGDFNIYDNLEGQDLVFARTRYAYEDLTEYFNDNYRDDLINFGLNNVVGGGINEIEI